MEYTQLINTIEEAHQTIRQRAISSINQQLVIRNWLIGFHIVEFEQNGKNRAKYGDNLTKNISDDLTQRGIKGMSQRSIKDFRQFYRVYPQLLSIITQIKELSIGQPVVAQSKVELINPKISPENLLSHFSFRHFLALMRIKDPLKRAFYEKEAIKGQWEARFLERQINSLLIERLGMSSDKESLIDNIRSEIETIEHTIKDPYILEFTGFKDLAKYSENDLETALLDKIQYFLQELGTGFCFEARQKRITIDGEHDRIDLVFYHRVLKCHILIDLKVRKFKHGDSGQMNYYLNYYKNEVMQENDNPPIGIILCTEKGSDKKVLYATTGLDNQVFVSKYQIALPTEKQLLEILNQ